MRIKIHSFHWSKKPYDAYQNQTYQTETGFFKSNIAYETNDNLYPVIYAAVACKGFFSEQYYPKASVGSIAKSPCSDREEK